MAKSELRNGGKRSILLLLTLPRDRGQLNVMMPQGPQLSPKSWGLWLLKLENTSHDRCAHEGNAAEYNCGAALRPSINLQGCWGACRSSSWTGQVAVVLAFPDGALLKQRAECPALASERRDGRLQAVACIGQCGCGLEIN